MKTFPLILACMLLAAAARGGTPVEVDGDLRYESFLLDLPGPVELVLYEDIDRDERIDVLAVHRGDSPKDPPRHLVVFFQRESGFEAQPDLRYRLPDAVCLIDLGNVDFAADDQELLMLTGEEIRWMSLPRSGNGRTVEGPGTPLVRVNSVFAHADANEIAHRDIALNRDEGMKATLFVPLTGGYRIFHPEDGYATAQEVAAEHSHTVGASRYTIVPADLHLADLNGDGREDLALTHLDHMRAYFAREGGRFSEEADLDVALELITEVDLEAPMPEEELVGFTVDDFDGDGLADIFVRKVVVQKKAVVNDRQQYQLFRNKGGSFELIPDEAFVLKSFDDPIVLDLDGDERLDIVTGYFEFSIGNIVKALITRSFSVELSFFLYGDDGFPDRPNETRDFKIRISLSNLDENFAPAVEIEGDYDGDEHKDFLLQSDDREVEIFLAEPREDRLFAKKASAKAKVYACNDSHIDDFNGDGRADMAFHDFPDRKPFSDHWVHVVLSR